MKTMNLAPYSKKFLLLSLLLAACAVLSCGPKESAGGGPKPNSPPVVSTATILPGNPTQATDLHLHIQGHDPDGDSVTYRQQWVKNDAEIFGETKNLLASGKFKKGDVIGALVAPSDGNGEGKSFRVPSVRVLNSTPVIQELRIEPAGATARDELKARVRGFDGDGDFLYYTYQWEKNGAPVAEERTDVLKTGLFRRGDVLRVIVRADDREVLGDPKKSEPLTISNSPPMIASSPPTAVKEGVYAYQVRVDDPDGDPVQFNLQKGPKRMEMDPKTGLIRWEIRREDRGSHSIEIEASDSEGAKSFQRYSLTVEFR